MSGRGAPLLVLAALGMAGCASGFGSGATRALLDGSSAPVPEIRTDAEGGLPAVEGLRAVSGALRAVPLHWRPVLAGPVAGYAIERSEAGDGDFLRIAVVGGTFSTHWTDRGAAAEGLPDGATRYYRVRAVAADGALGARSEVVNATTAVPPERPRQVHAISQLPRRVALSWEPSPDPTVTGYRISRSPSALGEFRLVAEIAGRFTTSWVDEGLGDLRVFHYRVAAVNAAGGIGDPSPPERAVTKPEPLPPDGAEAAPLALGRNEIRWRPNVEPDLAGYRIARTADGETIDIADLPADVTEFIDAGLAAGQQVSYAIRAYDRDGLVSSSTDPLPVDAIAYDLEARLTAAGVELVWNADVQGELAETRVIRVNRMSRDELGSVAEARFLDDAPEPGRRRYQLVGVREDGSEAPPSSVLEIQVPARPTE